MRKQNVRDVNQFPHIYTVSKRGKLAMTHTSVCLLSPSCFPHQLKALSAPLQGTHLGFPSTHMGFTGVRWAALFFMLCQVSFPKTNYPKQTRTVKYETLEKLVSFFLIYLHVNKPHPSSWSPFRSCCGRLASHSPEPSCMECFCPVLSHYAQDLREDLLHPPMGTRMKGRTLPLSAVPQELCPLHDQ